MTVKKKIELLQKLLDKSKLITTESSSDPDFKAWKNLTERTLIKIFGQNSTEINQFKELVFCYYGIMIGGADYSQDHLRNFRKDFKIITQSIEQYIEEFKDEIDSQEDEIDGVPNKEISKVFISHASKDGPIIEELIDLLETIGLDSTQIFCTSFEGYGIDLGENFLEAIKSELSGESLVLFVLTENFYNSPICMCELGATWVLSKEHIPVVVPPLNYDEIKGTLPLTQGFKINEPLKLNSFKNKIEETFAIVQPLNFSTWERKRDRICGRLDKIINCE